CMDICEGKIWVGTSNGAFFESTNYEKEGSFKGDIIVADTLTHLNRPEYLGPVREQDIANIYVDHEKCIWFCTQGEGLHCLKGEKLYSYNSANSIPDDIVNHVFRNDRMILLSTNSGLYISKKWSPETGFAPWTKICKGAVDRALYFDEKIYAVSSEGLLVFEYGDKIIANEDIIINLSSVRVNFKERNIGGFLQVRSNEKSLEFNFDVVNFNGSQPKLDYILKGRRADSIRTENVSYRLTQLIPGEYTLTVKNPINNGKDSFAIPFVVEPQFWETMLFKITAIVLILLLTVATVFGIIRRNKKKQLIKAQNEQLILEYKLIALKAQVNPHFMSNCLSAIQDLIMSNQNDKATYYIAEFGLMVRQILDYSSKQLISLEEELNLVKIYVELEKLRFDNKFVFKIEIDPDLKPEAIMLPPLILNPLIENAIWHGLLPIQNERTAQLHVKVAGENEHLKISIIDNGAGRNSKKTRISNNKNASYGLKITEQRMTNLNYLYQSTTASIIYLDLFDEQKNPSGTEVIITVPMNLAIEDNA
ncbi:MAG: histidine kinase, partial [Bacteroidia bacterium]|nr:histidine kinase [Bacteroidia bacterium]